MLWSIPLLLAKLWTVYPHFWATPPVRNVAHAIERASLLPLVGGSLFMLVTGVQNIAEGSKASVTSTETEIKLTIVARAYQAGVKVL